MKKRNVILSVVMVALVLVLAVSVLVACNPDPPATDPTPPPATETKTVTFKDGETVVGTPVTVNKGTALTADQIPSAPDKANYTFNGWYIGQTKVEAGYVVNEDVTALANYSAVPVNPVVTFTVNGSTVKTAEVVSGEKLDVTQLPSDPEVLGYDFEGWFNGTAQLDVADMPVITQSVTYTAKLTKVAYLVTFEEEGYDDIVKAVPYTDAVIPAEFIPAFHAVVGKVFSGWYSASGSAVVKAEVGTAIASDVTFTANFVDLNSFQGGWINTTDKVTVAVVGTKVYSTEGELQGNLDFELDNETGNLVYTTSGDYGYTISVVNDVMTFSHFYYDAMEDGDIRKTYTLTKGESVPYSGTYWKNDDTKLVIIDGIVTNYSSFMKYARMYQDGSAYKLEYFHNSSAEIPTIADVTIDEKGSLIITNANDATHNGMFVKAESVYRYDNYISGVGTHVLIDYTVAEGQHIYVYRNPAEVYAYTTVTGTIEQGNIVTIMIDDAQKEIKITEPSSYYGRFIFAGEEAGTYTGIIGGQTVTMVLDGFGSITGSIVEDATDQTYIVIEGTIICGDTGITVNKDDMTFTLAEAIDGGISGEFTYRSNGKYVATFYDFGIVVLNYNNGSSVYSGEYTANSGKVTVSNVNYYIDGTWSVEELGKVLVNGDKIYVQDGADINSHEEDFAGWWKDTSDNYVCINTATKKVNYNDTAYTYKANYNGTVLTFQAKENCDNWPSVERDYTVTVSGDTLTISHQCGADDGDGGVELSTVTKTYTKTAEPVVELDAFEGKWTKASGYMFDAMIFNGKGTVNLGNKYVAYTIDGGAAKFTADSRNYTATISGSTLTLSYYDDEAFCDVTAKYSKAEKDAFAGDWINESESDNFYQYAFSFDGYGTLTVSSSKCPTSSYYNGTHAYTISNNTITINNFLSYNWTFTLNDDGTITIACIDSDTFAGPLNGKTITKVGGTQAPASDAFAGTYKSGGNTIVFNGDGTGKYNDTYDFTYTISGNVANLSNFAAYDDDENTATLSGTSLSVHLSGGYGDNVYNATFTKQ